MVKVMKTGDDSKRKETKEEKVKRKYSEHKKRLEKLENAGLLEEFLDNHKCGRDIAKSAKANQIGTPRETPPHSLSQFTAGIEAYFKSVDSMTEYKVSKDGEVLEIPKKYPMTIESLCAKLGISYYWWNKYESGEGLEKYHEAAQAAKMTIISNILEGGLTNDFNAKLSAFYLQNISKLRERPDTRESDGIKNLNFITINNKEDLQLLESSDDIIDAEIIEDGQED